VTRGFSRVRALVVQVRHNDAAESAPGAVVLENCAWRSGAGADRASGRPRASGYLFSL
jgi:hypothetical protein